MHVLALPTRMAFVWIKSPAENEVLASLVGLFHRAHCFLDEPGEFAVRLVSAFVGSVDVLCVGLYAWQWSAAFAV